MPVLGYILFIGTGLAVFFISAFLVVLMRTKSNSNITMPNIMGQQYVDVHNELMRLRLKVRIDSKRYTEKNDGEIISQSIPAGKAIEAGSKLYITVNTGVDRLAMPDLKGQTLNTAKANLEKVLSGETYVNLEIASITYTAATEGQNPETVISQIPEAGKNITTREKVYLLVVESSSTDKSSKVENFKGQSFPHVAEFFRLKKIQYTVEEILISKEKKLNGIIESDSLQADGSHTLKVFYFPKEHSLQSGYEKISYKIDTNSQYKLLQESIDNKSEYKTLFENINLKQNSLFNFVFYRVGNSKLTLYDMNGKREKTFTFKSEL